MSKSKLQMSNQAQNPNDKKKYDLSERTAKFGIEVIRFCKNMQKNSISLPIISQLIRSATSIGANYMEADCAESKKDFQHKVGICKKEAKETEHWLRMMSVVSPESAEECRKLWKEVHELVLIFSAIVSKSRG